MSYSAVAYIWFKHAALRESRRIGFMQLTRKIRVFPAREQEDILWHLSERCRLLYNFALAEREKELGSFEEKTSATSNSKTSCLS